MVLKELEDCLKFVYQRMASEYSIHMTPDTKRKVTLGISQIVYASQNSSAYFPHIAIDAFKSSGQHCPDENVDDGNISFTKIMKSCFKPPTEAEMQIIRDSEEQLLKAMTESGSITDKIMDKLNISKLDKTEYVVRDELVLYRQRPVLLTHDITIQKMKDYYQNLKDSKDPEVIAAKKRKKDEEKRVAKEEKKKMKEQIKENRKKNQSRQENVLTVDEIGKKNIKNKRKLKDCVNELGQNDKENVLQGSKVPKLSSGDSLNVVCASTIEIGSDKDGDGVKRKRKRKVIEDY